MGKRTARWVAILATLAPWFAGVLWAQAGGGTAELREIHSDGQKVLSDAQIGALTGLRAGTQVNRDDLQRAADQLLTSGLFATVRYDFKTRVEGVSLTFHVTESPRLPAYYDNFPWFGDSELNDAIRAQLPFFDGTLPEGGTVVETATEAIHALLASRKLDFSVQHQVAGNPLGEGSVQLFMLEGGELKIGGLHFSDASLAANPAVAQHLTEIVGKPYSRSAIETFLAEQIRPIYLKQGFLHVQLGPPEVRLTGPPSAKLLEQLPVFVPVATGAAYHLGSAQWSGNNVISSLTLGNYFALKPGDLADGMQIEAAWEKLREEYGQRGYLDAVVQPEAVFNETEHTVSYKVAITEGAQYHMGGWVITGVSSNGEARVRAQFPMAAGDVFDKLKYEDFLTLLQHHPKDVFGDLPVHYENVGHWLKQDAAKAIVDVLLDFK